VDLHQMQELGYQAHSEASESDADQLAEFAGRGCYESWDKPNIKTATNRGYLANIIAKQHFSIFEHAFCTFHIEHSSRTFTHELVRHRHLGYSQLSQRYYDESESKLAYPPNADDYDKALLNQLHEKSLWTYRRIRERHLAQGDQKKKATETARAALMNATETKIVASGNIRSWREIIQKRFTPEADAEFHQIAKQILNHLKHIARNSTQDLGVPHAGIIVP
jgi:thymidylate synthase (FAD)